MVGPELGLPIWVPMGLPVSHLLGFAFRLNANTMPMPALPEPHDMIGLINGHTEELGGQSDSWANLGGSSDGGRCQKELAAEVTMTRDSRER